MCSDRNEDLIADIAYLDIDRIAAGGSADRRGLACQYQLIANNEPFGQPGIDYPHPLFEGRQGLASLACTRTRQRSSQHCASHRTACAIHPNLPAHSSAEPTSMIRSPPGKRSGWCSFAKAFDDEMQRRIDPRDRLVVHYLLPRLSALQRWQPETIGGSDVLCAACSIAAKRT